MKIKEYQVPWILAILGVLLIGLAIGTWAIEAALGWFGIASLFSGMVLWDQVTINSDIENK